MDYNYEALDEQLFQKLCQAILSAKYPRVQCLPVGQPDGGRDAVRRSKGSSIVYQVKFSRNPGIRSERDAVSSLIASEKSKINLLVEQGAAEYHFFTNIAGTSHLGNGSIDRINEQLSDEFSIPTFCWWRDEIDRSLDAHSDIKWSYPQVLRGLDFLQLLVDERDLLPIAEKYRSYVRQQYSDDREVKFRQAQLQSGLLDLFVDIPVSQSRFTPVRLELLEIDDSESPNDVEELPPATPAIYAPQQALAAKWLLSRSTPKVLRLVLEGAPGQGKSTVTQYVCQVHRMRLLDLTADIDRVPPQHLNSFLRMPFRVDLRDYATWLMGYDPFSADARTPRPASGLDTLESFLAHQVHVLSGGQSFSVDDLVVFYRKNHILIVLDGFDEVADLNTRARLLGQIRDSSNRLEGISRSLQIIVTSRPAAFALSPGFPGTEWDHHSLTALRRVEIVEYADRWLRARAFGIRDTADFKSVLVDRLDQPHISSLAQNPMQLAILLTLISTKGRSLPDKRTALYDSYMDLFFGREAEKDETVRNNRDLLVKLHQYVAWVLHSEAETGQGTGSVSHDRLVELVKEYVKEVGHEYADIEKLFTGIVERVGALVSRVQGKYEFEVQPLREYFTGRYLYESAPYSPAGAEKGGTKPQRFDAMARHPYWVNVVRFYCGCYSSGELGSLVNGLASLIEAEPYASISLPRVLALMLLSDYVFSQEPRSIRDVSSLLSDDRGFYLLLAAIDENSQIPLALPEKCGREGLCEKAQKVLVATSRSDVASRAGRIVAFNSSIPERMELWLQVSRSDPDNADVYGIALQIAEAISDEEQVALYKEFGDSFFRLMSSQGIWDNVGPTCLAEAIAERWLHGDPWAVRMPYYRQWHRGVARTGEFAGILSPRLYYPFFEYRSVSTPAIHFLSRYSQNYGISHKRLVTSNVPKAVRSFMGAADDALDMPVTQWASTLVPWNAVIEAGRQSFGERPALDRLAVLAAGIRSKDGKKAGYDDLLDRSGFLAERARYARLSSGNIQWWLAQIRRASSQPEQDWVLLNLFCWATMRTLQAVADEVIPLLHGLPVDRWHWLADSVSSVTNASCAPKTGTKPEVKILSPRFTVLVSNRLTQSAAFGAWRHNFASCVTDDGIIAQFCQRMTFNAIRDSSIDWEEGLRLLKDTGSHSQDEGLRHLAAFAPMSEAAVRDVLDDPARYPIAIASLAEQTLASIVLRKTPKVTKVAQQEEWFPARS
ncbi:MAG TPA: hypothetical protein VF548_17050 [Allosphingosinicella sp.]